MVMLTSVTLRSHFGYGYCSRVWHSRWLVTPRGGVYSTGLPVTE